MEMFEFRASTSRMHLLSCLLLVFTFTSLVVDALQLPTPVPGLAYGFYDKTCPQAEKIVTGIIDSILTSNVSEAAGIVRLMFHDCFVQGCDASVLINSTKGEQQGIPNLTLRPSALSIINRIKVALDRACPRTVSCADTLVLAGRDSVYLAGGPWFPVPTGRRDSLNFSSPSDVLTNLPAPFFNISQLISSFSSKGLNKQDLVALSGAHTIGLSHCSSFNTSLNPVARRYKPSFAKLLLKKCRPNASVDAVVNQEIVTPHTFDNQYFKNIENGEVLFNSDAALLNSSVTKAVVDSFIKEDKFSTQFPVSYIKMSMISVLTGSKGNIRKVCSVLNTGLKSGNTWHSSM